MTSPDPRTLSIEHARPAAKLRLAQLDSLRGLAAVMVIVFHCRWNTPLRDLSFFDAGYLWVDFFFVLSGFIMFYNYPRLESLRDFRRFLVLRLFRIYPLHLGMLAVSLAHETALHAVSGGGERGRESVGTFLLNLALLNGVGIEAPSFNYVSWSISAEFWTYVVFGLFAWGWAKSSRGTILAACGAVSVCALAFLLTPALPNLNQVHLLAFPRCLFSFFLGAALCAALPALRNRRDQGGTAASALQVAVIAACVALMTFMGRQPTAWELVMPVMFAAVIAALAWWPASRVSTLAQSRPLLRLGDLSYSIYMIHMVVLTAMLLALRIGLKAPMVDGRLQISGILGTACLGAALPIVLYISGLTHRWIEEPGRQLGRTLADRLAPRSATKPAEQVSQTIPNSRAA